MRYTIRYLLVVTAVIGFILAICFNMGSVEVEICNRSNRDIEGVVLFNLKGSSMQSFNLPTVRHGSTNSITIPRVRGNTVYIQLKDDQGNTGSQQRRLEYAVFKRSITLEIGSEWFGVNNHGE